MTRLLFWIALIVLVIMALRSKVGARPVRRQAKPEELGEAEPMACCAHCGLHFPASEAVRADGRDYCCPAHVRLPAK